MRRTVGAVLMVALLVVAVACSSSGSKQAAPSTSAGATATTGPASSATGLQSKLLSLSDMPVGWTTSSLSPSAADLPSCLSSVQTKQDGQLDDAAVIYASGGVVPLFLEAARTFSPGKASAAFDVVDKGLSSCTNVTFTFQGQTLTGSVVPLAYPKTGDRSSAYTLKFTFQGLSPAFDVVLVQQGDTLMVTGLADIGTPDLPTLQQLTTKALAKLTS